MADYDFVRLPKAEVQDYAEHGTPGAQNMAKELLVLRSVIGAAEAQASALHKIISDLIRKHGGPPAIFDFFAWADHQLTLAREAKEGGRG